MGRSCSRRKVTAVSDSAQGLSLMLCFIPAGVPCAVAVFPQDASRKMCAFTALHFTSARWRRQYMPWQKKASLILWSGFYCHRASMSLNNLISERPTAAARFTGTAFPICLYCAVMLPQNSQSSGKVWILAYSLTVKGLVSVGWHLSVCFIAGARVSVKEGLSGDSLLAMPVLPPPK